MQKIDIYVKPGHEMVVVPPPCDTCSSGGTCAGCDPEERLVDDVVVDFNAYYDSLGKCSWYLFSDDTKAEITKALALVFEEENTDFEVTVSTVAGVLDNFSPVVTVDGKLKSTNTLPSAVGLKKLLQV